MIEKIVKELFYCMTVMSLCGLFFLTIRRWKFSLAFSSILLFCLIWRCFSTDSSSRYYSIFIIYGLFLSSFASKYFFHLFHDKQIQKAFCLLLVVLPLCFQLNKTFSSFDKKYIVDLQRFIRNTLRKEPNSVFCIFGDEYRRLRNVYLQGLTVIIPKDNPYTFQDFYGKNSLFLRTAYFIVSDSYASPVYPKKDYLENGDIMYTKIQHHFSSYKHDKHVSVYKFLPFSPQPEIDIQDYFNGAFFKTYVPEYDAFIYQTGNKLIWLIGADIGKNTEIIYHIRTNRPDLLPESRVKYNSDNRGFYVGGKNELERIGRYRVFEKDIPSEYPVTSIILGFNTDGNMILRTLNFEPQEGLNFSPE